MIVIPEFSSISNFRCMLTIAIRCDTAENLDSYRVQSETEPIGVVVKMNQCKFSMDNVP